MRILIKLLLGVTFLASCGNTKKLQYIQGPLDASKYGTVKYKEPIIQNGDVLSITVFSDNPVASSIYNQPAVSSALSGGASTAGGGAGSAGGYLVDNNGNIQFHGIGKLTARGLTRQQLATSITEKLQPVLQNAYCQVRFANFKITVIGEVNRPSVFSVPSEKVSILEALGLAGDLTVFGRRDSVMIIRETDVQREMGWIDLRKTDLFTSDFYFLQQNDVVVVHPTRAKSAVNDEIWTRNISLAATLISSLAVVYSLLTR